ncbi:MAG: hypothetical protein JRK53_01810 [Deltaproteobacteria bacterium]|nr:hypothetical protein [Deltaproteobacteria bacterium]MBW1815762.1 hypothetical protein [Deltaproteobacteria bacterium]
MAIEHCQKSIEFCEKGQIRNALGIAWGGLGFGHYLRGELKTAVAQIEKVLKLQMETGRKSFLSIFYDWLSFIHIDSGKLPDAEMNCQKALELSSKNNGKYYEGFSRILCGRILVKSDISKGNEAEAHIRRGMEILNELKIRPFFTMGYLFLGELFVAVGQREKALKNLENAQNDFEKMGMDFWVARTLAVYSALYEREGDQFRARENLTKAIGIFRECGADGWVEKYEKELAAL